MYIAVHDLKVTKPCLEGDFLSAITMTTNMNASAKEKNSSVAGYPSMEKYLPVVFIHSHIFREVNKVN